MTARLPHPDPMVELFLSTDPSPEVIYERIQHTRLPGAPGKLETALRLLQDAHMGRANMDGVLPAVLAAYEDTLAPERRLLLLISWIRGYTFFRVRMEEVQVLIKQAESLITADTPPEFACWLRFFTMASYLDQSNSVAADGIADHVLDGLAPTSPHYDHLNFLLAVRRVTDGKEGDPQALMQGLNIRPHTMRERHFLLQRFIGCGVTGDLAQAEDLMKQINTRYSMDDEALPKRQIAEAMCDLALLAECLGCAWTQAANDQLHSSWASSVRALMKRDAYEALHFARLHVSQTRQVDHGPGTLQDYTLIRSELVNRHGSAALRLIRERQARGTIHYLDDFFLGRAHWLLREQALAAQHMAQLRRSVEAYGAQGRLDFEVALAGELRFTELAALLRATPPADAIKRAAAPTVSTSSTIVCADPAMRSVLELVQRFSQVDIPVLVSGETGTGKELVARALHDGSARRDQPYVEINCGALNEALIESELFGHRRGAFTGAQSGHKGLFLEAGRGTLFLDEIGEISPRLQIALLRVLESGDIRPVGAANSVRIECRIVAATNANLRALVDAGKFRADLLYRLDRLHIQIPPLRQRPQDVKVLSQHFVNLGRPVGQQAFIQPALEAWLKVQPWPGNVRELRNTIERMRVLNSDKLSYDLDDIEMLAPIPLPLPAAAPRSQAPVGAAAPTGFRRMSQLRVLFNADTRLTVQDVAQRLGVSRSTAVRDLAKLEHEGFLRKVYTDATQYGHYFERTA